MITIKSTGYFYYDGYVASSYFYWFNRHPFPFGASLLTFYYLFKNCRQKETLSVAFCRNSIVKYTPPKNHKRIYTHTHTHTYELCKFYAVAPSPELRPGRGVTPDRITKTWADGRTGSIWNRFVAQRLWELIISSRRSNREFRLNSVLRAGRHRTRIY